VFLIGSGGGTDELVVHHSTQHAPHHGAQDEAHTEKNFRDTIIGPRARAGFAAPPLTGPATSTHAVSANPMSHLHEEGLQVAEPGVGAVAPRCATVRACEP